MRCWQWIPGGGGGTPKLEERGGGGGIGGGGRPIRGRAEGGRLKQGNTLGGLSTRADEGTRFSEGVARPSAESLESLEWARGGIPARQSRTDVTAQAGFGHSNRTSSSLNKSSGTTLKKMKQLREETNHLVPFHKPQWKDQKNLCQDNPKKQHDS